MHFAGSDSDLCPHSELSAIRELGRGVVHQDRAIQPVEESLHRHRIFADDSIRVVRAMGVFLEYTYNPHMQNIDG